MMCNVSFVESEQQLMKFKCPQSAQSSKQTNAVWQLSLRLWLLFCFFYPQQVRV